MINKPEEFNKAFEKTENQNALSDAELEGVTGGTDSSSSLEQVIQDGEKEAEAEATVVVF